MRRLIVFNSVSVDGYFVDEKGDMSWAHNAKHDDEWNAFTAGNASGGGLLVFGRKTYELMAGYWPTEMALKNDPALAKQMNSLSKVVFSRTMGAASWNNTKLIKDNIVAEVRKMKQESGSDMVILGSGSIVSQLTQEHLIDEYQLVIVPVVLGSGRTMFDSLKEKLSLIMKSSRVFKNGNIYNCYEPNY